MTPKEIEQIISQIPDLRFQFLIRIQFHLGTDSPEQFFRLKKSEFDKSIRKSKGAEKIIQGYSDLFNNNSNSGFLLEQESVRDAVSRMENILETVHLDGKQVRWSEIRKS